MAKKNPERLAITPAEIEQAIHLVRGQRVMVDSDLAKLYGVKTSRLNEQLSRNKERFPEDFAFQLTHQEFLSLMSQIAISKTGRGGRRKLPWVFTEQGVAMLSSILRSPAAVKVNIQIMRTFVRLRRLMATPGELVEQLTSSSRPSSCTMIKSS
jgi:hypothetical protein